MEFFVLEVALIDVLVDHEQLSKSTLVVDPFALILGSIWPYHFSRTVSLIELPHTLELSQFITHDNIIELRNVHMPKAITLSILEIAGKGVTSLVICCTVTIYATIFEITILSLLGIFLCFESCPGLVSVFSRNHLIILKNAVCVSIFAEKLSFALTSVVLPLTVICQTSRRVDVSALAMLLTTFVLSTIDVSIRINCLEIRVF